MLINGQWTGPGTANPQAGEIAGANPGLTQLANYMGMSEAQTQAWISAGSPAPRVSLPAASAPIAAATGSGVPWYVWAAIGVGAALFIFGSGEA